MAYNSPHTIENGLGEKLVFTELRKEPGGDRLIGENFVQPGVGPLMHVHWHQDEGFTVISGRIGYQTLGGHEQYAEAGESVEFKRGVPHRFWNAGTDLLHCSAWIKPAYASEFFLSSIFEAQKKSGSSQPEKFDGAYLLTRYASEYDLPELPLLVKKLILPATYHLGRLLGKYDHFRNAPAPMKFD